MKTLKYITLAILAISFFNPVVKAQEEEEELVKEVQVVKAYEPTVSDAFKINRLPKIVDTVKVVPKINYSIQTYPLTLGFDIEPIRAAKMVGEPLRKLYNGYAKVGIGTKMMPTLQAYYNNLRSKEYSIGAFIDYDASYAKVTLEDDSRVNAGFSDFKVGTFGKKFFEKSILYGDLGIRSNSIHRYGFDTNIDTTFEDKDIKQKYFTFNVNVGYQSNHLDSSKFFYDFGVGYKYFQDDVDNSENKVNIWGGMRKYFNTEMIGADLTFKYRSSGPNIDSANNTIIGISPWVGKFGKKWRVKAGLSLYSDMHGDESNVYFYPHGQLEYDIVGAFLIPFAGVDGKLDVNSYESVIGQNPFVVPALGAKNANHKLILFAGIKGNMSSSTYYNIKAKYSIIDDMGFFVNDYAVGGDTTGSKFSLRYDNVELIQYSGELSYNPSEDFIFRIKGNYYSFKMSDEDKPWHKSQYDITFSTRYDLRNKIILDASLFVLGERSAVARNGSEIILDTALDLNLGVEYRYSKVLSAFLRLNNILGSNYQAWNYYPTYGFHGTIGVTYAF